MQHAAPVDSPQQFCLRWNNYQSNLTNVFDQLLQSESFVDVTLACDGHSVKAHKMVLSACSPYFQSLFFDTPCQHPIVILKDIKWTELKAVVEFMYKGEINVSQEQIGPLLKVAESLKIRGLADVNSDSEFGSVDAAAKKTSSGWDSRQSTPFAQDLSESAMSPSSILHRQKKRRRTSGERSSISSPEESIGGGDTDIGNSTLDMSPHTPSATGPMVNSHPIMPPHPPPQSGQPNIVNLSSDSAAGLSLPPPPPPPPPSSHMMDDLEIKPGIAEMIREEERAKLLESSQAWLGASTSSIAEYHPAGLLKLKAPLWTRAQLKEAIQAVVTQKMRFSQASAYYGIPKGTLYDNILGKTNRMMVLEEAGLTPVEENAVLEFCCQISIQPYNRRTKKSLRSILDFVEKLRRSRDPEFQFTGLAGFRWWWAFCKKHTIVSLYFDQAGELLAKEASVHSAFVAKQKNKINSRSEDLAPHSGESKNKDYTPRPPPGLSLIQTSRPSTPLRESNAVDSV